MGTDRLAVATAGMGRGRELVTVLRHCAALEGVASGFLIAAAFQGASIVVLGEVGIAACFGTMFFHLAGVNERQYQALTLIQRAATAIHHDRLEAATKLLRRATHLRPIQGVAQSLAIVRGTLAIHRGDGPAARRLLDAPMTNEPLRRAYLALAYAIEGENELARKLYGELLTHEEWLVRLRARQAEHIVVARTDRAALRELRFDQVDIDRLSVRERALIDAVATLEPGSAYRRERVARVEMSPLVAAWVSQVLGVPFESTTEDEPEGMKSESVEATIDQWHRTPTPRRRDLQVLWASMLLGAVLILLFRVDVIVALPLVVAPILVAVDEISSALRNRRRMFGRRRTVDWDRHSTIISSLESKGDHAGAIREADAALWLIDRAGFSSDQRTTEILAARARALAALGNVEEAKHEQELLRRDFPSFKVVDQLK